ncbi:MAG TPA: cysteine hydrolase [Rhizomicrobium sp.]|nr:cysteine hydrolase [Rhizomicrobium sp.]
MSSLKDWIAPSRTALLLVDCQVDFASPDGVMAKQGCDVTAAIAALRNASLLLDAARTAHVPCLFARLIARGETPAMRDWKARTGHGDDPLPCREGSRGAEFIGVTPLPGEAVFSKNLYSAFSGTALHTHLKAIACDTLVIAGLTTECCVDSTARDAFEHDHRVFIASDAVAAYEPGLHEGALKALARNCALLATSQEIVSAWK